LSTKRTEMVNRSGGETRGAGAVGLRFTLAAEAKSRAAGERKSMEVAYEEEPTELRLADATAGEGRSMAVAFEEEPTELRLADAIATAALAPEKEEVGAGGGGRGGEIRVRRGGRRGRPCSGGGASGIAGARLGHGGSWWVLEPAWGRSGFDSSPMRWFYIKEDD
jgi:hypothetical protein